MRKSGSVEKKCSDSARALPPSFRGGQSDFQGIKENWFVRKDSLAPAVTSWTGR